MKKTRVTKLLALLLCTTMVLSVIGCASPDKSDNGSTDNGSSSNNQTQSESEAQTQQPAEKEEITLTAFIQQSVTTESGIWQGWGAKRLFDDTKIKVDFYPTGNEVEQRLRQYLAGGSLPDIVGFRGLDQAQFAMDANMLLSLDDYKEFLPNIFESDHYKDAVAYSKEFTSNDTGNLLIMPTAIGPVAYNSYNWVPMLQWDAYKRAGMPQPETLEDYLDVVEAMVAVKPTTPEGEKVFGFSLFSDWDNYTALQVSTLSYFYGIDTEYVSHLMETNVMTKEINSILEDDSFYKRALKFYFDANQRGLLDPDSMTQTFSNVSAKYSAGRIMFSHFSWMTGSYNSPASGYVNNEEAPDGFGGIIANDMKLYEAPDQTIGRNWYFAISKNAKDPERAAEFLNWIYDPENIAFLSNGPEGVTWEYDSNGEPYIIDEGWELVDNRTEALMPAEIGGGSFQDGVYPFNTLGLQASSIMDDGYSNSYRYWPATINRNPTLMRLEVDEFLGTTTRAEYLYKNDLVAKSTQAVNMIPSISDEMQMTLSQIGEVVKKYSWQMVYTNTEAEFESLWQQMVSDADGLGMPQIVEYYENAWADALEIVKDYE